MRKRKRMLRITLCMLCLMMAFGSMTVQASKLKTRTKYRGITWGFKTNKKYVYYSYWGGVGMIPQNVKFTNWKDVSMGGGYRKLSFTITFTRKKRPTESQLIDASTYYNIYNPEAETSPRCYYAIVDSKTGMSLEASNPYGVRVLRSNWKKSKATTYRAKGYSISMTNTSVNVVIKYPKSYKRMCIGAGGCTGVTMMTEDSDFWNGYAPFWNTNMYLSPTVKNLAYFGSWYY